MSKDEATNVPLDNPKMRRFGMWMARRPVAERTRVFEEIVNGDEPGGLALATLCDLELSSASELLRGGREYTGGQFSLAEVAERYEENADQEYDTRSLTGALVDMAEAGLALMHTESSTIRGGYAGTSLTFRAYWPNVLDFWDGALDQLFRPDGHVYLVGGGGLYMIGRAKNVDAHVRQLSATSPLPIELEHAFPCEGYVEAERVLQEMYAGYRSSGEWFVLPVEAVAYMKGIRRMRGTYVEPFEQSPTGTGALIMAESRLGVYESKPGEKHEYKHYVVEEGFAMHDPRRNHALPFTFTETAWDAENLFWSGYPDAAAQRPNLTLTNAVRVTDTYIDYRSAGDPRHVYSRDVWERRKSIGIDMYD